MNQILRNVRNQLLVPRIRHATLCFGFQWLEYFINEPTLQSIHLTLNHYQRTYFLTPMIPDSLSGA